MSEYNTKRVAQNHILHAIDVRIDGKKADYQKQKDDEYLNALYGPGANQAVIEQLELYRGMIAGIFKFLNQERS